MAFTTTDLAAIDAAIASGELTVRTADGKTALTLTPDGATPRRTATPPPRRSSPTTSAACAAERQKLSI